MRSQHTNTTMLANQPVPYRKMLLSGSNIPEGISGGGIYNLRKMRAEGVQRRGGYGWCESSRDDEVGF